MALGAWVAGKLRQMWASDDAMWVECPHGAVCAGDSSAGQCSFVGHICTKPGCVAQAQNWWTPVVSAAAQHVSKATVVGAFASTSWAPPEGVASLGGGVKVEFPIPVHSLVHHEAGQVSAVQGAVGHTRGSGAQRGCDHWQA